MKKILELIKEEEGKKLLVAACDIESTLSELEGWEYLAMRLGESTLMEVKNLRRAAMNGEIDFAESFHRRAALVKPSVEDWISLQPIYIEKAVVGAKELIQQLKNKSERVILISGGVKQSLIPFVQWLGIDPEKDFFAIEHERDGNFPVKHPLYFNDGKELILRKVIQEEMGKTGRSGQVGAGTRDVFFNIMIGDGMTDAVTRKDDVKFVAVGDNPEVLASADAVLSSFL